jgi:hypothetical protein
MQIVWQRGKVEFNVITKIMQPDSMALGRTVVRKDFIEIFSILQALYQLKSNKKILKNG